MLTNKEFDKILDDIERIAKISKNLEKSLTSALGRFNNLIKKFDKLVNDLQEMKEKNGN